MISATSSRVIISLSFSDKDRTTASGFYDVADRLVTSDHGGEGRVRRIDITVTPYAAPQSDYTPSDSCSPNPLASSA